MTLLSEKDFCCRCASTVCCSSEYVVFLLLHPPTLYHAVLFPPFHTSMPPPLRQPAPTYSVRAQFCPNFPFFALFQPYWRNPLIIHVALKFTFLNVLANTLASESTPFAPLCSLSLSVLSAPYQPLPWQLKHPRSAR